MTNTFIRGSGLGGGIGSILYSEKPSQPREYFLYNVIGSVVVTCGPTGNEVSTSLYEAFGKVIASTGSSDNNRLFCTKERSESIGLDNFGFRYFDWEIGRFIQRDPSGYPDGLNNYLYCSNNPINRIDPLGLKKIKDYEKDINKEREANKEEQDEYIKKSRKDADYDSMTKEEKAKYLEKERAGLTEINDRHESAIDTAQKAIDNIKRVAYSYNRFLDETGSPYNVNANDLDDEKASFKKLDETAGRYAVEFARGQMRPVELRLVAELVLGELGGMYAIAGFEALSAIRAVKSLEQGATAILKDGYYEVNGVKISKYYYEKLWKTGRGAPSLITKEILTATKNKGVPDMTKKGFYRYETNDWELIYNPKTKEVWHLQPKGK